MSAQRSPLIETRSIDFIPEAERHGSLYSQFTLWLGANLQITAIVTGALAVVPVSYTHLTLPTICSV